MAISSVEFVGLLLFNSSRCKNTTICPIKTRQKNKLFQNIFCSTFLICTTMKIWIDLVQPFGNMNVKFEYYFRFKNVHNELKYGPGVRKIPCRINGHSRFVSCIHQTKFLSSIFWWKSYFNSFSLSKLTIIGHGPPYIVDHILWTMLNAPYTLFSM